MATAEEIKYNSDETLTQHGQPDTNHPSSLEASNDNTSPDADVSPTEDGGGYEESKENSGDLTDINKGGEESKVSSGNPADNKSGVSTDILMKKRRAERFGMPVQLSEQEKRNSRAERFATGPGLQECDTTKKSDDLKRKARAERHFCTLTPRFGLEQSVPAAEEEKKKARLARFAPVSKTDSVDEDKKKARALRFSETSTSLLHPNGKGIEPKTAISNKAGGGA